MEALDEVVLPPNGKYAVTIRDVIRCRGTVDDTGIVHVWNIVMVINEGQFRECVVEARLRLHTAGRSRSDYNRLLWSLGIEYRHPHQFNPRWLRGRSLLVETRNEDVSGGLRTVAVGFDRHPMASALELGETNPGQMVFAFAIAVLG